MAVQPFRFDLDPGDVAELRGRLARTRWPDQLPGTTWEYGADTGYVRDLCAYWQAAYDFDAFAARINAFPQVTAEIDGQRMHAYDVPAAGDDEGRLPLVLVHGWPGSVAELLDVIGPLSDPAAHGLPGPPRRVIVPSLPGYGFSGPTTERGVGIARVAELVDGLLGALGVDRYVVHGGDWGSWTAAHLALLSPERVAGIHLTMLPWWLVVADDEVDADDAEAQEILAGRRALRRTETGYQAIQGTKPQTLAVGLTDSPAGLAAWIAEKFSAWTDDGPHPESTVERDRLLDDVSVYWFTGTINASTRIYYESAGAGGRAIPYPDGAVPIGFARYPGEPFRAPRAWAERTLPIVRWTEMERGGHFPALEDPGPLAAEVQAFAEQVDGG